MSATHTFGISTNTIPSSTETSIKSATVTTPVSESTNTGMSIFMSTTTESKQLTLPLKHLFLGSELGISNR